MAVAGIVLPRTDSHRSGVWFSEIVYGQRKWISKSKTDKVSVSWFSSVVWKRITACTTSVGVQKHVECTPRSSCCAVGP